MQEVMCSRIASFSGVENVAMVERQSIFLLTGATHMSRPVTMRSDFFCGWGLSLPAFFALVVSTRKIKAVI